MCVCVCVCVCVCEHTYEYEYLYRIYITLTFLNSSSYFRHILTVQDRFTRYLVAVPIPDLETKTILNALIDRFFLVHGMPETIHTDTLNEAGFVEDTIAAFKHHHRWKTALCQGQSEWLWKKFSV